jgi:hypothetical protein
MLFSAIFDKLSGGLNLCKLIGIELSIHKN